jgi:hypothetical protein
MSKLNLIIQLKSGQVGTMVTWKYPKFVEYVWFQPIDQSYHLLSSISKILKLKA